jgi:hypothetical protein
MSSAIGMNLSSENHKWIAGHHRVFLLSVVRIHANSAVITPRKKTRIRRSCAGPSFFASTDPRRSRDPQSIASSRANRKRLTENGQIAGGSAFSSRPMVAARVLRRQRQPTPGTSEPQQHRDAVREMSSCGRESGVCRPVSSPHAWLSARRSHSCTNFSVGGTGLGSLGPGATSL